MALERGKFRVRGDSVDIWPPYDELATRVEFWGDTIESIAITHPTSGEVAAKKDEIVLLSGAALRDARGPDQGGRVDDQARSSTQRLEELKSQGKLLEAQRLNARTRFDIEMLLEAGFCPGIENYSRPLSGRAAGQHARPRSSTTSPRTSCSSSTSRTSPCRRSAGCTPATSSRKMTLVDHGFRLPSALDNRPLMFDEWEKRLHQTVYVSATPGVWELARTGGEVVEQVIRPTGLLDPVIEIVPAKQQVPHLSGEIEKTVAAGPAGARHHAHEETRRGSHHLLPGAQRPLPLAAQRARRLRARGAAQGPPRGEVRRARGREPPPRGARPARKCRSWRSSTPTRRASCGARPR